MPELAVPDELTVNPSASYPTTQAQEIQRENIVRLLTTLFMGAARIVTVEGEEGIGKTTLFRQFIRAHSGCAVAIFVSSASRWAYSPRQARLEMCHQIASILGEPAVTDTDIDDTAIARYHQRLAWHARKTKSTVYFVLDGLDEIPTSDEVTRSQLVDILPFGFDDRFRFLLSGPPDQLPLKPVARRTLKPFILPGFTREEADRYLAGLSFSEIQRAEIYKTTAGVPGRLASVRRLAEESDDPASLVSRLPEAMAELFQLEWRKIDLRDDDLLLALAILAHEPRAYTSAEVAAIINASPSTVTARLAPLKVLERDKDGAFSFVSEMYRRFAAQELGEMRQRVNDLFIEFYSQHPDSEEAVTYLPSYFASAERLEDLVRYLSPERFARLYSKTSSLRVVQTKVNEGIAAARKLGRDDDLVRFTIQQSAITEIASSETAASEVRARTAVGDYDTALALAEAAARPEVKLRLLAVIGRARKEQHLTDDAELITRLRDLFDQIEPGALGDQAVSAACDLLYSVPDLAIKLVSAQGADSPDSENAIDWGLARLALAAQLNVEDPNAPQRAEAISGRIQDPATRRLSAEATVTFGRLSAAEAIAKASQLESTGDRLYVLQHWMRANRRRPDAVDVLASGVAIALQATGYTANARVFCDLALCLPYLDDVHQSSYYLRLLDGQRGILERLGPAIDFVRLGLILARTEWRQDRDAARIRFEDLFNTAAGLKDLVVRATALARLFSALEQTDPQRELDRISDVRQLAEAELSDALEQILTIASDHYDACKGVVEALAFACPRKALGVVARFNTEWRRDLGHRWFVDVSGRLPIAEINFAAVTDALGAIVDPEIYDDALGRLTVGVIRRPLDASSVSALRLLAGLMPSLNSASHRARMAARVAAACAEVGVPDATASLPRLTSVVTDSWALLEASWQKLDVGLTVVATVANCAPALARQIITDVNVLKAELALHDAETSLAATLGLRLAVRAFAGLVLKDLATNEDFQRLLTAISRCGTIEEQVDVLAELALRCKLAGEEGRCAKIVQQHLVPLVTSAAKGDALMRYDLIRRCAAALYSGAANTALGLFAEMPDTLRDEALRDVIGFVFRKTPPGDAYERGRGGALNVTYEDANGVVALLRHVTNDSVLYAEIETLVDSALAVPSAEGLKRPLKAELARQLGELAREQLPNPRFITHDGYLIVALAQINRLRDAAEAVAPEAFAIQARAVPNLADRAYVMAVVAASARGQQRQKYLAEARQITDAIPILADRLERYQLMSSLIAATDASAGKELLRRAVELSLSGEGPTIESRRQSLVDLAYRIDPDFASSLASATDDDPAKKRIAEQVALYRLKDSLADSESRLQDVGGRGLRLSQAAWLNLGSLNARRTPPVAADRLLPLLSVAARQPISRAFPIFALFIENAVRRASNTGTIRQYVLPLYEACLRGAEIALYTSRVSLAGPLVPVPEGAARTGRSSFIVRDGERAEGIDQLRAWLAKHVRDRLWIMEPYFDPTSVELLALVREVSETCNVVIVASRKDSLRAVSGDPAEAYRAAWYRMNAGEPPPTKLVLLGARQSGKFPVHDRWWLCETGGVYLGTSYGGIGSRVTSVTELGPAEAATVFAELSPYFEETRREYESERLTYVTISL